MLFLCQTLPIPEGGASIRSYNLLRQLARTYDVTVLSFYRKGATPQMRAVADALAATREFADVETFPVAQEFSRLRLVGDHLQSLVRRRSYTTYAYASDAFAQRVREHVATGSYSLVHVDSLDLVVYLPLLKDLPVACTHQNVESALMRRRAAMAPSPLARRYMEFQAALLEADERHWCPQVRTNLVVSADEAATLARIAPGARIVVAANGVDTEFFQPRSGSDRGVVFVGPASWRPNEDAMRFLGEEILPRVREGAAVDATWVGRASDAMRASFAREYGITMTGFLPDVRPTIADAACYVVPLRTGGGTRLKILEAWAMGKAVVSTSVGCEGLAAEDGVNILVRDDADDFAKAVRAVLADGGLRARLGRAARETAVRLYDWEVIGNTIVEEYSSLIERSAVATVA